MNRIVPILLVIGILGVGAFVFFQKGGVPGGEKASAEILTNAWVEIISSKVYVLDNNKERELKTGDEILPGKTVFTDTRGEAVVHFPDGSELRLDNDTKMVLTESYFSSESADTRVSARLLFGRIWSKVISLASPASAWEVKSSSAVATVRGTAFAFEYRNGDSWIISAEHSVDVKPVNPKTDEVLDEAVVSVSENKNIHLTDEQALAMGEGREHHEKVMIVVPVKKEVLASDWVKKNLESDEQVNKIEETMDRLREEKFEEKEIRQEMKRKLMEDFKEMRKERGVKTDEAEEVAAEKILDEKTSVMRERMREIIQEEIGEVGESADEVKTTEEVVIPVSTQRNVAPTSGASVPLPEDVARLVIEPGKPVTEVIEGAKVLFSAYATDKAGVRRNVTTLVRFGVLGPVGSMEGNVFVAKLGEQVSEIGEGKGSVQAVYVNERLNIRVLSNSVPVTVLGGVSGGADIDL